MRALPRLGLMRRLLPVLLLLLTSRAGIAQFSPTQDLSLKGLTEVDLLVTVGVDALPPTACSPSRTWLASSSARLGSTCSRRAPIIGSVPSAGYGSR